MRLKFKLALGLLLALTLLLALRFTGRPSGQPQALVPASPSPFDSQNSASMPAPTQVEQASPQKQSTQELSRREELKKYLTDQHPASIETRIDKRDPFISRYRLLGRRKVLLSAEESQELETILKDQEKWNTYQEYLRKVNFNQNNLAEEQMYRLFILQYFESSLSAQKDSDLIPYLIGFVLEDNFGRELSTEVKKTLAYEKLKVISFLSRSSPGSLDVIRQRMRGLRHEKLLLEFLNHPTAA